MTTRSAMPLLAICALLLTACGSDPRTERGDSGNFAFAPVKTTINAEPSRGAPVVAAFVPVPKQGFVSRETNVGGDVDYVFDATSGMLTGVWTQPDLTGAGAAATLDQKHQFKLPDNERNALVRLINLAWGARQDVADTAGTQAGSSTIWLLDGAQYKAIDARGAGQVISASLITLAQKHGVVRDDHER